MRPKKPSSELELFRAQLEQILDRGHPLFKLAGEIDWPVFEDEFGPLYPPGKGRPGLPIRLMVGLHYLKHAFDESGESVVERLLALARRIHTQQRHCKNKVYSVHAPEVECIAKGKAHKRYEFGCKVGVAATSKKNWIVGVEAYHGNPYDGHTLKGAIEQVKQLTRLTGWTPKEVFCDRGYRGHDVEKITHVHLVGRRKKNRAAPCANGSSGGRPSSPSSAT